MPRTILQQILGEHLVEGELVAGSQISIRIDQTLCQDATGTMAFLELEAMGVPRVKTEVSVQYIDHNTIQMGPENANDTSTSRASARRRASYSPVRAMASATRSTWSVLAFQARPFLVPTPIPRLAAALA